MPASTTDKPSATEPVRMYRGTRDRVHALAEALAEAPAVSVVAQRAVDTRELGFHLLSEGMAAVHLTRIVAELNDVMTQRLIDLIAVKHDLSGIRWCWMALGSEGRFEQTLYTDQDNALIFEADNAEDARQRLLTFAREVNHALARCGFRLCPGDIMAGNPRWCLTSQEWRGRFADWVDTGDPEALLHGAIFFDFRALHGNARLAEDLRDWLSSYVAERPLFLRQMSENALRNQPRLGPFRPLQRWLRPENRFDIKLRGVSPFSDAARVLALSRGLSATSTTERLRSWARTANEQRQVEGWSRAFNSLQTFRLDRQMHCFVSGSPMDNQLIPARMSTFDLAVVCAALREARSIQQHLAISYQLRQ
ncbi:DUF294 nucleotidyltransferase-like domain-containing protein [Algiphilus aromaticivorans]|jgi:CBS domain-containing protein|uniref:DUF294 nucleotidyltransferase-like domain-containing protein n=1 Tax=Algiphilus aromaticivorans TaxID=382454 RepID=UPI000A62DDA6|nr:DUF294 nucleotidyltransferase-like domain-containing protein [Algiphilus aromaticivorans]